MKNEVLINVPQKVKVENVEKIKVTSPSIVYNLKEVQAIKNAVQEHFLFIGLDNCKNLKNINILGIGSSNQINIDYKYVIRTALVNACDNVILVHNHPSNSLEPSIADKKLTNYINKLLKVFNVKLLDHVIVTEKEYVSMLERKCINKDYKNKELEVIDNMLLLQENKELKNKIKLIKRKNKELEV